MISAWMAGASAAVRPARHRADCAAAGAADGVGARDDAGHMQGGWSSCGALLGDLREDGVEASDGVFGLGFGSGRTAEAGG